VGALVVVSEEGLKGKMKRERKEKENERRF